MRKRHIYDVPHNVSMKQLKKRYIRNSNILVNQ